MSALTVSTDGERSGGEMASLWLLMQRVCDIEQRVQHAGWPLKSPPECKLLEELCRDLHARSKCFYGDSHMFTLMALEKFVGAALSAGMELDARFIEEAEGLCCDMLRLRLESLGAAHADTARSVGMLGGLYAQALTPVLLLNALCLGMVLVCGIVMPVFIQWKSTQPLSEAELGELSQTYDQVRRVFNWVLWPYLAALLGLRLAMQPARMVAFSARCQELRVVARWLQVERRFCGLLCRRPRRAGAGK